MGTNSEARKRKQAESPLSPEVQRIAVLESALLALGPALDLFVDVFPASAPLGDVARKACEVRAQALVWRPKEA